MMETSSFAPYFRVVVFDHNSKLVQMHRALVVQKYSECGFLTEEEKRAGTIADMYDTDPACYFMLYHKDSEVIAGTFRIIRPHDEYFLPLHTAYPSLSNNMHTHTCESSHVVAVPASSKEDTGNPFRHVLLEVVVRGIAFAKKENLASIVSLGTPSINRWINRTFGKVQHPLGERLYYHGGYVIPYIGYVEEFEYTVPHHAPTIWRYYKKILDN